MNYTYVEYVFYHFSFNACFIFQGWEAHSQKVSMAPVPMQDMTR
jgi:hypothetical protein